MRIASAFLCCIVMAIGAQAQAARVYRCTDGRGTPAYQDQPCGRDKQQRIVHVPDAAPLPPVTPTTPPHDEASATTAVTTSLPPAPAPQAAPPSFFLCTRYDGSRYVSDDGVGARHAVPLGILGVPERSLADAYGGRNGIGVSAPGLRPIPRIPAAQAPLAGSYVWIDDVCHHAQPAEACAYLRDELATLQSKLRRAFSDEEPTLKARAQSVRERLHGC